MSIMMRFFDNFEKQETQKTQETQKNKQKFSLANEELFKEHMPKILESWGAYLKAYADKSKTIFSTKEPELPWLKFDEPTWVSSLAIAIAKNHMDAILVEELPVRKRSSLGNADMWCCLNPTEENNRFSFYLEAKSSSWARRQLFKHRNNPNEIELLRIRQLKEVHNQIANDEKKDTLLSRVFRDYQKSAGKLGTQRNYTTTSPHKKESGREHDHVFLTMIIKPVLWDEECLWDTEQENKVKFSALFEKEIRPHIKRNESGNIKPSTRNFYNYPSAGIIMRDKKGFGFIALVLMLGEAKQDNR